jgi:hypothetical protein
MLQVFTLLGFHEFMPSSEILSKLEGQMCMVQPYLCVNLLSIICGYNPDNLDIERLPIYLNYTPSGTSVKNMAKWSQQVRSRVPDALYMFDYGTDCRTYFDLPRPCNQVVYGQDTPPAYDLSRIKTPLVLFTGKCCCTLIWWCDKLESIVWLSSGQGVACAHVMALSKGTSLPLSAGAVLSKNPDCGSLSGVAGCCAGGKDILADPTDTLILLRNLPKVEAHFHEPKYGEQLVGGGPSMSL